MFTTYVFGVHDVATLADGSDALIRVVYDSVRRRRHCPRLAVTSARVGRDTEFHATGYADFPRVT